MCAVLSSTKSYMLFPYKDTGNLTSHFRHNHPNFLGNIEKQAECREQILKIVPKKSFKKKPGQIQRKRPINTLARNSKKFKTWKYDVAKWVIMDQRPANLVESDNFRHMIKVLNGVASVPSRTTIKTCETIICGFTMNAIKKRLVAESTTSV